MNGGQINGVRCFSVDKTHGLQTLAGTTRLLNVNQTTPPLGPTNATSDIIFSEDGSKLIVTVKGTFTIAGFLATWDVNPNDSSLSPNYTIINPLSDAIFPFQMKPILGTNHVLNVDAGFGFAIYDFSHGDQVTATAYNVTPNGAVCWLSHSLKTQNYYITDLLTSVITEVQVDTRKDITASIVKQYTPVPLAGTIDSGIATVGNNEYVVY